MRRQLFGLLLILLASGAVGANPPASDASPLVWPSVEVARRGSSRPGVLGPLTLGMSQADVEGKLGRPTSASRRGAMNMSDEYTYSWEYPAQGVTVYFAAWDETSDGSLMAIKIGPPCDWVAVGGLQVGMNIDQTDEILRSQGSSNVTPLGSVGTDTAGLYYALSDTAVIVRLESGKIAGLYVGPNLI